MKLAHLSSLQKPSRSLHQRQQQSQHQRPLNMANKKKYADPKSLAYRVWFIQQRRRQRKESE
jgi:hypothetical protein